MKTITTPDFMGSIEKIIEEVRNRTCLDAVDTEVFVSFLQASLEEKYNIAISSAYDAGHSDGYDDGYENGYADCNAKNH